MLSGRFVTFCFAWIDTAQGVVSYANAGHNPPILVRHDGGVERLTEGGTVMGVFADAAFKQDALPLRAGDRLVFFTDGVTETRNDTGEELGDDRLTSLIVPSRALDAEALKDAVLGGVNAFNHGLFDDDATLIVVEVQG
jgi:serine phosphatase RsbU (regulator of sigma subunit)